MTLIAPTLQSFFAERLTKQRQASPRTIASYRDTMRLLLGFIHARTGRQPSAITWDDLDATTISAFLDYLETDRHNSARTRNVRLTAIRSLFHYASLRHPEHADLIQHVLAIPPKRFDKTIVSFLDQTEIQALLDAPDRARWEGRRDRAMILLTVQTGLRVSELTGLNCGDITLGDGAHVRCEGKGRKQRSVPLTTVTDTVMRTWIAERAGGTHEPLFPTRTGRRLSRDAIERLITKHAATASTHCATLLTKNVHPHVLRHSCAMSLLHANVDTTVIALWLGHVDVRSTQVYLHADITIKERALAAMTSTAPPGRYRPPDRLLAFLEAL